MFLNEKIAHFEQGIIKFSWQEHVAARHKVNCSCTNQIAQMSNELLNFHGKNMLPPATRSAVHAQIKLLRF
jgi:hypothetical protein